MVEQEKSKNLAIVTAILDNFDTPVNPIEQKLPLGIDSIKFHRWTYENFPKIADMSPRLQYRLPKFFSWQMLDGYDYFIWLDGSLSLTKEDGAKWFMEQLGNADIAVFKHPWRKTIKEESDHIEDHLQQGKPYITARYKNGLHKEQLRDIQLDTNYTDDHLHASTAFIYRDSEEVRDAFRLAFLHQARYYTCDQLAFTYALKNLTVKVIDENPFKASHLEHVSKHK